MKSKFVSVFLVTILVISLMTFVMASPRPTIPRPHMVDFTEETEVAFRPLLSLLIDKETINIGESATFTIDLTTTVPDDDYTDGTYQVQYAGWVFADKDGKVIKSKEFVRIYGSFSDTVVVQPSGGEYALVGLIIQYDQTYDSSTSQWITSPEVVKVKESSKLTVTTPQPPTIPKPGILGWIENAWSSIKDWFSVLFG